MSATEWQVDALVAITSGSYAGKKGQQVVGQIKRITDQTLQVAIQGSGEVVRVKKTSVTPPTQTAQAACVNEVSAASADKSCLAPAEADGLSEADTTDDEEVEDLADDLESVSIDAPPSLLEAAGGLVSGGRVDKIVLQRSCGKKETCFLKEFLEGRTLLLETPLPRGPKAVANHPGPSFHQDGRRYELVSRKIVDDGVEVWGGKKHCLRLLYASASEEDLPLQRELERVADFASLPNPRKVASRLELLQSPAPVDSVFKKRASDFETIPEPQPSKESGGCGFIPDTMLCELLGGRLAGRRATAIQVRIFAPRLGVFKGMLCRKPDIKCIQLPPSMRKVPPSRASSEDWVWLLVKRVNPSKSNLQVAKWVNGGVPCSSFKQSRFSDMVGRLLRSLDVPERVLRDYTRTAKDREEASTAHLLRKDAWLVGLADPTDALPARHVFIPGLPLESIPVVGGKRHVFLTRSPCVRPSDGKRLPVLTDRPEGMTLAQWEALRGRAFGEVIFTNKGAALPESISGGDLDGDLYWVSWDEAIVQHVQPRDDGGAPSPKPSVAPGEAAGRLGEAWLARAQEHMVQPEVLREGLLIGKLFRLAEKKADERGLGDPDAQALYRAYTQQIDSGKHGGELDLSEALRKELGI